MDVRTPGSFWRCGPQPGQIYNFPGETKNETLSNPIKKTLYPTVTGTSVLGIKFKGGVAIAADMLGSYGALARYRNISRIMKVTDNTVLAAGGDYADYQFIKSIIEQRVIDEDCLNDGFTYTPNSLFSWLTRVMYNRRTNINPLWNVFVVGGYQDGEPFLGYIDKIGVAYEAPSVSSGYGAYIAQPILRQILETKPELTEAEAIEALEKCLKILFYRDARSLNKFQIAIINKDGVTISDARSVEPNWEVAKLIKGYE